MSDVVMRGTRENVVGLLRLMAEELGAGLQSSDVAFSEHVGCDPSMTLRVEVDDEQRMWTTLKVRP